MIALAKETMKKYEGSKADKSADKKELSAANKGRKTPMTAGQYEKTPADRKADRSQLGAINKSRGGGRKK